MKASTRFGATLLIAVFAIFAVAACSSPPASSVDSTVTPANGDNPSILPTSEPSDEYETVEALAPIESVEINIAESFPPQYFLHVVPGLPSGCAKFNQYEMTRAGNEINVKVTNLVPAPDQLIACTDNYGFHESNIALGSDFEGGQTYTVHVNDATETFVAQGASTPSEPEMVEAVAPIEAADVQASDGEPTEYTLIVMSRLPRGSSCSDFGGFEVVRDGDTVSVAVTNLEVAEQNVECTADLPVVRTEIPLGIDFEPGVTYAVHVNDFTTSFTAGIAPGKVKVSEPAPIESVKINVAESFPLQYFLHVVSGLPNGCSEFEDYEVTRDGNDINVRVTNLELAPDQPIACTLIYRMHQSSIALGSDFEDGQKYTAHVNDVTETFVAGEGNTQPEREMVEVAAPIDDVEVQVSDGDPAEYSLIVVSRMPRGSSCSEFGGFKAARDGDTIHVTVTNLEVAALNVPCTRDLPVVRTEIPLGSDFEPGVTYEVIVNDVTTTFVARGQGGGEPAPLLGREFRLEFGKSITIEPEDLRIKFVNVVEDSRCPVDALCVWAGRAIVLIGVTSNGRGLGELELRLDPENQELVEGEIGDFLITISELSPHPKAENPIEKSDYIVSLIVTEAKGTVFEY